MHILCLFGIHKFEWPEHDQPFAMWTYVLWCKRGCGNFAMRLCTKWEHAAHA